MAFAPYLKLPTRFPSPTNHRDGVRSPPPPRRRPSLLIISAAAVTAANENGSLRSTAAPPLRVAYQGAPGAYSEFAAKTACPDCTAVPYRTFTDAIAAVERGAADRAVLPVESTTEGTALRNYDLLLRHDVLVAGELSLFVHYCLLAMPGVSAAHLRRVISHPVALAHCGRALSQLGSVQIVPVNDTAGAVEMLLSGGLLDTAAIASPRTASLYGLDVIANGIQDESWNVTRFLVLSNRSMKQNSQLHQIIGDVTNSSRSMKQNSELHQIGAVTKTSMVVAHRGASMMVLLKVLSAFSSRNVNLTKLEVNNSAMEGKGPVMVLDVGVGTRCLRSFPHVLYVDFEGSLDDPRVKDAINEIAGFSVMVRILGSYAADTKVYDLC